MREHWDECSLEYPTRHGICQSDHAITTKTPALTVSDTAGVAEELTH